MLTKIVFTVFHNRASDILRGSKQWWTSKISRGSGPSNPRRIDTYGQVFLASKLRLSLVQFGTSL